MEVKAWVECAGAEGWRGKMVCAGPTGSGLYLLSLQRPLHMFAYQC